jgi:hypothetical protein
MSSYVLRPKVDVVIVEKKTRGKFPGEKAPAGTVGLVWSRWVSNSQWATEKISLLTESGNVLFTTARCASRAGNITDFPKLMEAYKQYAEEEFVPAFGLVKKPAQEHQQKARLLIVKFISKDHMTSVPTSCIHYEDLEEIFNSNSEENFFCMRIEPWFLEKAGIL